MPSLPDAWLATPRKFPLRDRLIFLRIVRPDWLETDDLRFFFENHRRVLTHGRLVLAAVIQANRTLYEPSGPDAPGEIVYDFSGGMEPGDLLQQALEVYRQHFGVLFPLSLIVGLIQAMLLLGLGSDDPTKLSSGDAVATEDHEDVLPALVRPSSMAARMAFTAGPRPVKIASPIRKWPMLSSMICRIPEMVRAVSKFRPWPA